MITLMETDTFLFGALVGWYGVKQLWPNLTAGNGPIVGAIWGGGIGLLIGAKLTNDDPTPFINTVFDITELPHQQIAGVLVCILSVWVIAKLDRHVFLMSVIGSGFFGLMSAVFFASGEMVTGISTLSANFTWLFGLTYFWRYLGGTEGKGFFATAMFIVPIFLFYFCPSFPNFSEPYLRIISAATLGLLLGGPMSWVIKEGIRH